ncbi:hypothetical protein PVAND_016538 [Polypedilum vanderplanki]|uniref:G-protein coupled receptors family 1 profile domain-containing protein n=1 Tax=Polypedilum vanderplanki TaxID=319348 RepID=A0A9J6BFW2_POLVA|nr:hypothetical protein PVAND_016538 [Polypedilum vanderplanki]
MFGLIFVLLALLTTTLEARNSNFAFVENFHPGLNDISRRNYTSWCSCSNDLIDTIGESECHCEGQNLLAIPKNLHNVTRLSIANANIKEIVQKGLNRYSISLRDVILTNLKEFNYIEPYVFRDVINLRTIYISYSPKLEQISAEAFYHSSKSFKMLKIMNSGLKEVPNMKYLSNCDILSQVDFEGNFITEIHENSIRIKTEELNLDNNFITTVQRAAFNGSAIGKLSLKGNRKLSNLDPHAFEGILNIRELDLSNTAIHSLSTKGLDTLEILRIQNTHTLKQIPSVYNFKSLEKAFLTHSFHCCAFKFPNLHDPISHKQHLEFLEGLKFDCRVKRKAENKINETDLTADFLESPDKHFDYFENLGIDPDNDIDRDGFFMSSPVDLAQQNEVMCGKINIFTRNVQCHPKSDALNPCEDVMGKTLWLRVSVWIVVSLAVIGNSAVLVVLLTKRAELTVPEFLMCNLAFADLCMGIYLMLLGFMDLYSMNEYFNYAYDWQYGIGCKTAGFLTVFAVHLSIFTLTTITIERWFAITKAVFLNKRLRHRKAIYIMICGWLYSIAIALMPLFGVSNYSSTSICLPMEAKDLADIIYLTVLMLLSGLGFFIIVICYVQIYFNLGDKGISQQNTNREMLVAKKMALLVFTNFACWAPITFFGVFALVGHSLIDVRKAKILLVFFYPLNSCANPYLYAILTSQYRRDAILLLSKFGFCSQRVQEYRNYYRPPNNSVALNVMSGSLSSSQKKYSDDRRNLQKLINGGS